MLSVWIDQLAEQTETIDAELRAGHTLMLVKGGKRFAEIVPARPELSAEERQEAWKRMLAVMEKGVDLGGRPFTYEERHG